MREHFNSLAACTDLIFTHRKSRKPLPSLEELNAQRQEAVSNGFIYLKGKCGVTVFWLGEFEAGRDPEDIDEYTARLMAEHEATIKKRKLIPGVGFADSIDL